MKNVKININSIAFTCRNTSNRLDECFVGFPRLAEAPISKSLPLLSNFLVASVNRCWSNSLMASEPVEQVIK